MLDGQKSGGTRCRLTNFMEGYTQKPLTKSYAMFYDYESKLARKQRAKGLGAVKLTENMYFYHQRHLARAREAVQRVHGQQRGQHDRACAP